MLPGQQLKVRPSGNTKGLEQPSQHTDLISRLKNSAVKNKIKQSKTPKTNQKTNQTETKNPKGNLKFPADVLFPF